MLRTVLVANRGEIAVRVVRTCAELGIRSVAVHSDPDEKSLHVRLADETVRLPGSPAAEPYLDPDRIIAAAISSGADAVHPGYGFLSENASFAAGVERAGLTFVGPSSDVIRALGDKESARALAAAEGVPVLPGLKAADLDGPRLRRFGDEHGWPLLIKPGRGGGGAGMRVVTATMDATAAVHSARAQARAAFGDGSVYAERFLANPRHIEVQLLADRSGRVVPLGDRDCSVQRRHQKLVEECPAAGLGTALRRELSEAALRLARRVGYVGAGTVEFLVEDRRFHFLEFNPRIQVEHPVTEAVFGIDLIREQLLIAAGGTMSPLDEPAPRGHAIECRINAEDPARGFLPAPGTLGALSVPWRPGVRLDTGYAAGDEVPAHYDSLMAKLVVWGPSREVALHRLRAVLAEAEIHGVPSTHPALSAIAEHPDFLAGGVPTGWFEKVVASTLPPGPHELRASEPSRAGESGAWIAGRFHRVPSASRGGGCPRPRPGRRDKPTRHDHRSEDTAPDGPYRVRSPMHGTVTALTVAGGDTVAAGQVLGTVEAMKMEHPLTSPVAGRVRTLHVRSGQLVTTGELLLDVERPAEPNVPPRPEGHADAES